MSSEDPAPRDLRASAAALFAIVLLSYGYFYHGGQDNENARLGQVVAIVDHGRLDTPPALLTSADVIRHEGRFYSNKAPGATLLAVPPYWVFSRLARVAGVPEPLGSNVVAHLTSWSTVGLASALLAAGLFVLLEHALGSAPLALLLALAYSLGSIAFPFSTLFFSHQLAAALAFLSFALLVRARRAPREEGPWSGSLLLAGFLAGFALATEYPALLAVGPVGLYAALVIPPRRWPPLALGALAGGLVLVTYNLLAFDQVYFIPYAAYADTGTFAEHELGYMGVHLPDPGVLAEITIRPQRGLFVVNPWLALMVPALLVPLVWRRDRLENAFCALIVVAFWAFNAGYGNSLVFWGGGASVGPRHLLPMLPFATLLIAPLLRVGAIRMLFYALGLGSLAIMLLATATEPRVPYEYANPLRDLFWDDYVNGRLATHYWGAFGDALVTHDSVAFNLGKLLGLSARWQLLPLLLFWVVGFGVAYREASRSAREARAPAPSTAVAVTTFAAALSVLFAIPFALAGGAPEPGGSPGLRGSYAPGILWESPTPEYAPRDWAEGEIAISRVDPVLIFPWYRGGQPIPGSFSTEWTGSIYVPETGAHRFATDSDDGSAVWIDDRLVVDNWGDHARQRRDGVVELTRGFHAIAIRYYNAGHAGGFQLLWARPRKHLQPIATEYLWSESPEPTGSAAPH